MSDQTAKLLEQFSTAVKLYQAGRYAEAEQLCTQVHNATPAKPDPLNLLAILSAQKGNPAQAENYFTEALQLAPDRVDIQVNRIRFLIDQNHHEQAIGSCVKLLERDPRQSEVHFLMGLGLRRMGRLREALKSFEQTLQFESNSLHALTQLANTLYELKEYSRAVKFFHEVLQNSPDNLNIHLRMGHSLKHLSRFQDAYNHYNRASNIDPRSTAAQLGKLEVDPAWLEPLEGRQLILRPHQMDDAPFLHRCFQDRAFMDRYNRFTPRNHSIEELSKQIHQNSQKHPCQTRRIDWTIIHKRTQEPLGLAALADIQFRHSRAEFLVGFPEKEKRQGGKTVEASLLIFDFAFNKVRLNKLTSRVYGTNPSAQSNTLALGFTQESYLREHICIQTDDGQPAYLDLYGNGLLNKDFRNDKRLSKLAKKLLVICPN